MFFKPSFIASEIFSVSTKALTKFPIKMSSAPTSLNLTFSSLIIIISFPSKNLTSVLIEISATIFPIEIPIT